MSRYFPDPKWSWDDAMPQHNAMASAVPVEVDEGALVAKLWVPDIEARHKWREVWVRRDVPQHERRRLGL